MPSSGPSGAHGRERSSGDLTDLLSPTRTAVVTQECQRGVIGDLTAFPELAAVARESGAIENMARLVRVARDTGVPVVHCLAHHRRDRRGGNTNARLFAAMAKRPEVLAEGTESVEVIPEIGVAERDLVLSRLHGLGPAYDTGLDSVLRNLGVDTVVGIGVSLNIGLLDLAFDAVNAGYAFVLPVDAVAGVPAEYGAAVIEHTLSLVATITTTDEIVNAWTDRDARHDA